MRNTHKIGKVLHDSRTTKVERSQSFDVAGGGKKGNKRTVAVYILPRPRKADGGGHKR